MTYKPDYCIRYIKPISFSVPGEAWEDIFGMCSPQSFDGDLKWKTIFEVQAQGIDIREAAPEEIAELLPKV